MRLHSSSLFALCAALCACADGASHREIAAPDEELAVALTRRPVGIGIFPLVPGHTQPIDVPSRAKGAGWGRPPVETTRITASLAASSGRATGDAAMTYLSSQQTYTF